MLTSLLIMVSDLEEARKVMSQGKRQTVISTTFETPFENAGAENITPRQ